MAKARPLGQQARISRRPDTALIEANDRRKIAPISVSNLHVARLILRGSREESIRTPGGAKRWIEEAGVSAGPARRPPPAANIAWCLSRSPTSSAVKSQPTKKIIYCFAFGNRSVHCSASHLDHHQQHPAAHTSVKTLSEGLCHALVDMEDVVEFPLAKRQRREDAVAESKRPTSSRLFSPFRVRLLSFNQKDFFSLTMVLP